jgi:hypothetical protein
VTTKFVAGGSLCAVRKVDEVREAGVRDMAPAVSIVAMKSAAPMTMAKARWFLFLIEAARFSRFHPQCKQFTSSVLDIATRTSDSSDYGDELFLRNIEE